MKKKGGGNQRRVLKEAKWGGGVGWGCWRAGDAAFSNVHRKTKLKTQGCRETYSFNTHQKSPKNITKLSHSANPKTSICLRNCGRVQREGVGQIQKSNTSNGVKELGSSGGFQGL